MRIRPDDEVWRVRTVWLGPQNWTLPWAARYQAYGIWLASFLLVLLMEALTPFRVGIPPIWEICMATLWTYGLMTFVDHEKPLRSVFQTFWAEIRAPRPRKEKAMAWSMRRVRVSPEPESVPPERAIAVEIIPTAKNQAASDADLAGLFRPQK